MSLNPLSKLALVGFLLKRAGQAPEVTKAIAEAAKEPRTGSDPALAKQIAEANAASTAAAAQTISKAQAPANPAPANTDLKGQGVVDTNSMDKANSLHPMTKLALAWRVVKFSAPETFTKSALMATALGAGKLLGGKAIVGGAKLLGGAGRVASKSPVLTGAGAGGVSGGILGADENNTWGDTARNIGLGAAAGATAGHFGGKQLGDAMRRTAIGLTRGGNGAGQALSGTRTGLPSIPGIGNRLIRQGTQELGYQNHLAQGAPGIGGEIGRRLTPELLNKITGGAGTLASYTVGKRSTPFVAGSMLAAPFAMADGAQQAQDQIAQKAPQMMQTILANLPWQARLKYMMDPTAFNQYLTPELMQQLMAAGRG